VLYGIKICVGISLETFHRHRQTMKRLFEAIGVSMQNAEVHEGARMVWAESNCS
jgi:hypothetical protein